MNYGNEIFKEIEGYTYWTLYIGGAAGVIYAVFRVDRSRIEHLNNGGVLACGSEGKTEIIDEGYRISGTGLAILSKSGKKWSMKKCTPFPAFPKK